LSRADACWLAHVNIARLQLPLADPQMHDLTKAIDRINALAETSHGFVWRLPGDETTRDALSLFSSYVIGFDVERFFLTLSVWDTIADLHAFVYHSEHLKFLRLARRWTEPLGRPHVALWWLPRGHLPTIADSRDRLTNVFDRGASTQAFTFQTTFPPSNRRQ
jgi:hypothetical protein